MNIVRPRSILQTQLYCQNSTRAVTLFTTTRSSLLSAYNKPSISNSTISKTRSFSSQAITTQNTIMHHVLIVGGGPAGSSTAFWLAKAGFKVTVAERSTVEPYGQGIDITGEAVDVVKKMGLWDEIKANTTGESGFAMLDDAGKEIGNTGTNAVDNSKPAFSPTNEIEIMRGTLTNIIADAAKKHGAEYRYGQDIQQDENSVTATLSDNGKPETFTAIIGADGVASRVRKLTFDESLTKDCFKQTDTYVAYFSMDVDPKDHTSYSILQHANKGRVLWIRPIDTNGTRTSGYVMVTTTDGAELNQAARHGTIEQQKALLERLFEGVGGIRDRIIGGMNASTDFYFTRVVQVKLDTWHNNRCGLVGDAAYCPSPLTGQGTTMAVLGSYMIAGELIANPNDPAAAFTNYKKKFGVFAEEEGAIPLGGKAPKLFCPQSDTGIWIIRSIFGVVARPGVQKFFASLPSLPSFGLGSKKFELPDYESC
ncbi:oxidoreductase [Aureobasidium subglaciale]|nr:oxidoreductase [Aureobasidium subglaciale]KAI5228165.1 oxidoreductase [Aureobasidium subglaciale]KAI5231385.1 oxidoreductase [Aureobasidium subglaciale]KAI5259272.1 oxidoreductase [Aureobasidium subglaciale]KAI5265442.1 oxidoreductase [Aureobasidium subglaciale]